MRDAHWSRLLKQNYIDLIQYFNSEEGKMYFCRSKNINMRRDYPLLDDKRNIFIMNGK
jgi:hypothetical protein